MDQFISLDIQMEILMGKVILVTMKDLLVNIILMEQETGLDFLVEI